MKPKQNVLFILADQWRADCLGSAGHPVVKTPNLDALAREGTSFEHCYGQTSPCGPSRMCIFTGRYLCGTAATQNCTPLMDAEDNLAQYLRDAGFAPGLAGYNDYAVDPRTLPAEDPRVSNLNYDNFLPGFDVVLDHEYDSKEYFDSLREKGYSEELLNHKAIHTPNAPADCSGDRPELSYPAHYAEEDSECHFLTDAAIGHIRKQNGQPWALSLNYIKPHPPRICCKPYSEMYDQANIPPALRRPEDLASEHPYLKAIHRDEKIRSDEYTRALRANYYGMISEVDANLGRLFQTLKDDGLWDNTLIIFSSDHGEYLGDHYLLNKSHFYDASLRVPLIIRDPSPEADATRGQRLSTFVESIDTTPTILEYLGVPIPDRVQGQSYLGQVRNRADASVRTEIHHEYVFEVRTPEFGTDKDRCRMWVIRDHGFKYVQFGVETLPPLLFDLQKDPGEFENLAGRSEYASVELEYCQRLIRWRIKNEDFRMSHWADELRARKKL